MKGSILAGKKRFCICAALIAVLFAGCGAVDPEQPTQQNPPATQMPSEVPTEPEVTVPDFCVKPGEADGFIHSHPLGTTVRYDLNGDGVGEDITATAQEYGDGKLVVGNTELIIKAVTPTGYFTILNVNQQENELLIGISDYGFSDDPVTVLYAYDGNQITEIGYYEDITGENAWNLPGAICHGDGIIYAKVRLDILGTWDALAQYRVESGVLKDITNLYYYCTWEEQPDGWEVATKMDIIMYEDIQNEQTRQTIPAGTNVTMIGIKNGPADKTYLVCFDVGSVGKTLWMNAEEVEWCTYVPAESGMVRSEEAFDGFFYAG